MSGVAEGVASNGRSGRSREAPWLRGVEVKHFGAQLEAPGGAANTRPVAMQTRDGVNVIEQNEDQASPIAPEGELRRAIDFCPLSGDY